VRGPVVHALVELLGVVLDLVVRGHDSEFLCVS
jgi:hypothetical protein